MLTIIILTFLLCNALADGAKFIRANNAIEGRYIVILNPANTRSSLRKLIGDYEDDQKVIRTHAFSNFIGYSAKFDESFKDKILNDSRVAFVEQDQIYSANQYYTCSQSQAISEYFLKRVSQTSSPEPDFYRYVTEAGIGVNAYVLDTGIYSAHSEFTGRVVRGPSFIPGQTVDDGHGHGTCCAGILAGTQFGVAKRATIIAVKVLSNSGSGSTTGVIAGLAYTFLNIRSGKKLVSMSLGGSRSFALNLAVRGMQIAKIPVFVAAGNSAANAGLFSPASEPSAITVAASDSNNALASFSNFGSIVDIIAPGVSIKCAEITAVDSFTNLSGTSMAAPLAAGVGAVVLSSTALRSGAELAAQLILMSRKDIVTGLTGDKATTPNRLLYNGCI